MIGMTNAKTGGEFSFSVFGGLTRPASPKTNCVWVETSTNITRWEVGAKYPEAPEAGNVFILMNPSTSVKDVEISGKIDKLRHHHIKLCPSYAYQYIDGAWVNKPMKIYSEGTWVDTLSTLYDRGVYAESFTSGWSVGETTDHVAVTAYNGVASSISNGRVDLTGIQTVQIEFYSSSYAPDYSGAYSTFYITNEAGTSNYKSQTFMNSGGIVTWNVDVSDVNQIARFSIEARSFPDATAHIALYSIKLVPGNSST